MSVINQMLKDLEERAPKPDMANNQVTAIEQKKSLVKVVFLTLIVLIVLNGLGLYIWFLIQENQLLKEKSASIELSKAKVQAKVKTKTEPKVQLKAAPTTAQLNMLATESEFIKHTQAKVNLQDTSQDKPKINESLKSDVFNTTVAESVTEKVSAVKATDLRVEDKPKASMSVSRRQLMPTELVEQKLAKAEKAINANLLSKAEQLFEEVLIIEPEQQQARKKLAALWFGRKALNDAINLLSQGIALAPKNSEFRSMQANIFLQQGRLTQAYKSLKPLADLQQQAYQLLIVNISQQLSKHDAAIQAYKILLAMQPKNSRWHLGLATVYDKNSQFALAIEEYSLALKSNGLSSESSQFANQRIQAIGVQ